MWQISVISIIVVKLFVTLAQLARGQTSIRISCPMVNPLSAMVRPLENFWFIQILPIL